VIGGNCAYEFGNFSTALIRCLPCWFWKCIGAGYRSCLPSVRREGRSPQRVTCRKNSEVNVIQKPEMVDRPFVVAGGVVLMGRFGRTRVFTGAAATYDDYFATYLYKGLRCSSPDHVGDDVRGRLSYRLTLILCHVCYVTQSLQTL
jgi:hypothetical protein